MSTLRFNTFTDQFYFPNNDIKLLSPDLNEILEGEKISASYDVKQVFWRKNFPVEVWPNFQNSTATPNNLPGSQNFKFEFVTEKPCRLSEFYLNFLTNVQSTSSYFGSGTYGIINFSQLPQPAFVFAQLVQKIQIYINDVLVSINNPRTHPCTEGFLHSYTDEESERFRYLGVPYGQLGGYGLSYPGSCFNVTNVEDIAPMPVIVDNSVNSLNFNNILCPLWVFCSLFNSEAIIPQNTKFNIEVFFQNWAYSTDLNTNATTPIYGEYYTVGNTPTLNTNGFSFFLGNQENPSIMYKGLQFTNELDNKLNNFLNIKPLAIPYWGLEEKPLATMITQSGVNTYSIKLQDMATMPEILMILARAPYSQEPLNFKPTYSYLPLIFKQDQLLLSVPTTANTLKLLNYPYYLDSLTVTLENQNKKQIEYLNFSSNFSYLLNQKLIDEDCKDLLAKKNGRSINNYKPFRYDAAPIFIPLYNDKIDNENANIYLYGQNIRLDFTILEYNYTYNTQLNQGIELLFYGISRKLFVLNSDKQVKTFSIPFFPENLINETSINKNDSA